MRRELRTGECLMPGKWDPFVIVLKPLRYRDPSTDCRPIIAVEIDCATCHGTGYYRGGKYSGPCRLCRGTGLTTVEGYVKEIPRV
jgi:hypothetical protein